MANIHETAIVMPGAELASDVEVGAYAYVGAHVRLGNGTKVLHHGTVDGHTTIGSECEIGSYAVIGGPPQDLKYKGEPTKLIVGDRNVFRECSTVNTGTVQDLNETRIGSDCLIMAYVHVGHDCVIGNNVILANYTGLSGHVKIEDYAILSGNVGVAQSVRIGKHAFIGGFSAIDKDVAPYIIGVGNRIRVRGINLVGLKRRGYTGDRLKSIIDAHKIYFDSDKEKAQSLAEIEELYSDQSDVQYFVQFIKDTKIGLHR